MRSRLDSGIGRIDPQSRLITSLPNIERYFRVLFYAALTFLWGGNLVNGTVKALLLAAWRGRFENGVPLRTDYTGFPPLDYCLAILVAFFFSGTNGQETAYQLFLFDLYINLQLGYLWLYAEAVRPGPKPKWIRNPMYLALLWQALGGAVAMPLYFGMHIRWTCKQRVTKVADPHQARALATAFWLGAVVPMLCLMAPTWQGQASRSPATQQGIVAFFQPTPLYASGIMMAMTRVSTHLAGGLGSTTETRKEQALAGRWIRRLYLAAAALAAIGHLYVVGRAFQAADGGIVTLTRMYVPSPFPGPAGVGEVLVRGPWLFLQWDGIIIALASLSWGVILLKQALPAGEATTITVILASLVGAVVLGPGPTVTLALYVREGYLQEGSEERTQRGN